MKMVQALKCFGLIFSLAAPTVHAGFTVSRSNNSGGGGSSTSAGTTVVSTNPNEEREVEYTGSSTNCSKTQNYAAFELVRNLMPNPDDFKVDMISKDESDSRDSAKLQVKVTLPPYNNACVKFKLVPIKAKGQTLHIRMKMLDPTNQDQNYNYKKYVACLEKKESSIDGDKPVLENGVYHPERSTISDVQHMLFDLDVDPGKNVNVYFDSPFKTADNGDHGNVFGTPSNIVSCYKSENFEKDGLALYKSPESEAAERAYTACTSKDHRAILSELERLRSAGNANQLLKNAGMLQQVLNGALENAREDREKAIFEEMEAVANEFKEFKKEGFREDDEDLVKESAKKYVALLTELDEISIHPSVKMVEALLAERKKGSTSVKDREAIDEEIERLNEVIGRFDKKNRKQMKVIFEGLKEYSLVDQAYDIEGFRLKSDLYNKVHKDRRTGDRERRPMLTLEGAADRVKRNLKKFESRTNDWEDAYLAKRGYSEPIKRTEQQYNFALKRFKSDEQKFQQNEQKMFKKYCQPNFVMFNQAYHQRRCQKYQQGKTSRMNKYLKIRQNQLGYIQSRKGQYDQLNAWYSTAIQRQSAESYEDNDPFGFYSYTPGGDLGVDDNFSMAMPTMPGMGANRGPAGYGGGVSLGSPSMGAMGGQNPYAVPYGRPQGVMPQQGYFNGGYRGY